MTTTSKLLKLSEESDCSEEAEIIRWAFWKITELKAKKYLAAHPYEVCPRPLEWQPIDYSQAGSVQKPFDEKEVLVRGIDAIGDRFITIAFWNKYHGCWMAWGIGKLGTDLVTHWMPVPEFMKGKK